MKKRQPGDRSPEIMRLANEIAALADGCDRKTAAGLIDCIAYCAFQRYDTQNAKQKGSS